MDFVADTMNHYDLPNLHDLPACTRTHHERCISVKPTEALGELNKNHKRVFVRRTPEDVFKMSIKLKKSVFDVMEDLEGWCSKEKASFLIDLILARQPKIIVEIGVFGGKSLVPMALSLKSLGKGVVYGVDPWCADESAAGMDPESLKWWSELNHNYILDSLVQKINAYELNDHVSLLRVTSERCPEIPNIDLLHIDGNHSERTSFIDVTKWVPLVKAGGYIIFDDVNWSTTAMATAWLSSHCTKVAEFTGENVWGVWIKNRE